MLRRNCKVMFDDGPTSLEIRDSRAGLRAYPLAMRNTAVALAAMTWVLAVGAAPTASAEPVSDHHSANPYLENFWRALEGRGFGYLDWLQVQGVWPTACGVLKVKGATYNDAANVVVGHSFSPAEAMAIVDSAATTVCIGFN